MDLTHFVVFIWIFMVKDVTSSYCHDYTSGYYDSKYCEHGCCGSYTNRHCCGNIPLYVGLAIGGFFLLVFIVVCVCLCVKASTKSSRRVGGVQISTVSTTPRQQGWFQQPPAYGVPSANPPPYPTGPGTNTPYPTGPGTNTPYPTGPGTNTPYPTGPGTNTPYPTGQASWTPYPPQPQPNPPPREQIYGNAPLTRQAPSAPPPVPYNQ